MLPWTRATTLSRVFKKLVRRAGLPESYCLYDCRHTAGTAFTMAGVDTTTAMRILGHSTVQAHQRYIHVSAEYMEKVMSRVRQIYGLDAGWGEEPRGGREWRPAAVAPGSSRAVQYASAPLGNISLRKGKIFVYCP